MADYSNINYDASEFTMNSAYLDSALTNFKSL